MCVPAMLSVERSRITHGVGSLLLPCVPDTQPRQADSLSRLTNPSEINSKLKKGGARGGGVILSYIVSWTAT